MLILRSLLIVVTLFTLRIDPLHAASEAEIDDRTRAIATELRCVVCQNLSVADSPSEMAQQMRALVREQVAAGKSPEEIKNFFVSKYGEWVLLKPKTTGIAALLWILPYAVLVLGVLAALWFLRRWSRTKKSAPVAAAPVSEELRSEFLNQQFAAPDLEDSSPRATLLREEGRLKTELAELEFDFQSGKFSDSDYAALKQETEAKAAAIVGQLHAVPAEPIAKKPAKKQPTDKTDATRAGDRGQFRRWQLLAGGLFLMLFGLALGVFLTKSVRPRASSDDTMTGDFLTGTSSSSDEVRAAMEEGKRAFGNQEFPKAIEAFKKVLAAEPDNPEAHSYMGFILIHAGHSDGALMAFDKALSRAPNFPMALWGKGMILYQDKKDFAGARTIFEQLLNLVPPGEERNQITQVLAEIPTTGGQKSQATTAAASTSATSASSAQISGKITIDPKLKAKLDPNAALFIIARPAGGAGGPPLAVKKIDHPTFPLDYSLSQQNVMMQGMPFTGKINITVRLDKDGNPITHSPGDMSGDYKKNPADVGTKSADVVIDQEAR
ncbi:MAG: cytochrome c-type biogenesis protein CcmH [Chloroflexota bacterium]